MIRSDLLKATLSIALLTFPLHAVQGSEHNAAQVLGKFGESSIREVLRAQGYEVFDLNTSGKGIDVLARRSLSRGAYETIIVEIKTRTDGKSFQLSGTQEGKQLSPEWIKSRLETAAKKLPDPVGKKAASEALALYAKDPKAVRTQLHGISLKGDRYSIWELDPKTGKRALISEQPFSDTLQKLSQKAKSRTVSADAQRLGTACKRLAKGIPVAVVLVEVFGRAKEGVEIERRYEEGKIGDDERVLQHAKNAAGAGASWAGGVSGGVLGASAGAALGSLGGPPGAAVGAVIGALAGSIAGSIIGEAATEALIEAGKERLLRGWRWIRGQ